ncbi:MAG: molybdate ABC transporter permease subunit [Rhodothermales bacterium]
MLSGEEWAIIALSLRVALVSVLVALPPGVWLAYHMARRSFPGVFLLENLVQLPLVLPPIVTGYLLLVLFSPEGALGAFLLGTFGIRIPFTWTGACIAAGVVGFPLLVQTVRVAIEQIRPEWEEAVYVYGGGTWEAFRYVVLPLAGRGIAAGFTLAFARALGEFGATIVLAGNIPGRTRTLPLAIFTRLNQVGGDAGAWRLVWIAVGISILSLIIHTVLSRRLHNPREGDT